MSFWGTEPAPEPTVKLVGLSNSYPLGDAVIACGIVPAKKPNSYSVTKLAKVLEQLPWPAKYANGACVVAAWLGGASDINGIGAAFTNTSGTAQAVCDTPTNWYGGVPSVSDYVDQIRAWSPAAADLLTSAGNASEKAAEESTAKNAKEDVAAVKKKAKEVAGEVVDAAATTLKVASFGIGGLAVIALVVAAIIYLPKVSRG